MKTIAGLKKTKYCGLEGVVLHHGGGRLQSHPATQAHGCGMTLRLPVQQGSKLQAFSRHGRDWNRAYERRTRGSVICNGARVRRSWTLLPTPRARLPVPCWRGSFSMLCASGGANSVTASTKDAQVGDCSVKRLIQCSIDIGSLSALCCPTRASQSFARVILGCIILCRTESRSFIACFQRA
jgi:hypothetical protein